MQSHEHYLEAEDHLQIAAAADYGTERERYNLEAAQVHATLALAAALNAHIVDAEILPADNEPTP